MLRAIAAAAVAAFLLLLPNGITAAHAANACVACQNTCWKEAQVCKKHHAEAGCVSDYGNCKLACKGSPLCTESCVRVKGHAKTNAVWHGATCYSGQGCSCEAIKCAKAPHYRAAKCVSPPG